MAKQDPETSNKSPFMDQSYEHVSNPNDSYVADTDNEREDTGDFSFNDSQTQLRSNSGSHKQHGNNRVFSDESFKTVKLPSDKYSFDNSDLDADGNHSAMATPNINVSQNFPNNSSITSPNNVTFSPPPITSPSTSRRPSLRFKLPTSGVNQPSSSPFMDSNKVTIPEYEEYNFQKPNSPFTLNFAHHDNSDDDNSNDINDDENYVYNENEGMKRHRWGTTRNKKGKPKKENISRSKTLKGILKPQEVMRSLSTAKNSRSNSVSNSNSASRANSVIRGPNTNSAIISAYDTSEDEDDDNDESQNNKEPVDPKDRKQEQRSIVLNQLLPEEYMDPETMKSIVHYPRNKIRTTKYTPLSFLPKNISNQFIKNVANIYFLAMNILGFFEIFGVPSPELAIVPLIVIVLLTAIKDAIEDSRRTASDLEVNNQYTHILTDQGINPEYQYENINCSDEKVSLWRRFKKLNSRILFRFIGASKRNLTKEGRAEKIRARQKQSLDNLNNRKSFDSDFLSPKASMDVDGANPFRQSFQSIRSPRRRSGQTRTKSLKFAKKYWKDVKVGDFVRIYNNEEIPADVVIFSTSEEDNGCYVETKNLDGETNLKVKQSLKYGNEHKISKADDIMDHQFQIDSEGPHPNLYSYQGNLSYIDANNSPQKEAITVNNMLLRGCFLRNTKWVVGMVIFTGDDTKIMINAGITPSKQSRVSRDMNYYVIVNFILVFVICLVAGLVNGFYYDRNGTSRDYFEFGTIMDTPLKNGIISFFVALILYQSLVPISLYITIEIIKSAQAFFIYSDIGMYYERLDFPCTPKSWSISDDLGQIEYVFSDKTGTLTQNLMEFKKCTINGVSYGRAYTETLAGLRKRQGFDVDSEATREKQQIEQDKIQMISDLKKINSQNLYTDELSFVSTDFVKDLTGSKGDLQKKSNEHFMLALALCHSVLIEKSEDSEKIILKAQSPDEAALVETARSLGFAFTGNTKKGVLVDTQGTTKEYQVLNVLEFNSTRKRMSALIKIPSQNPKEDPKVLLICKGADSIIYERLAKSGNDKTLLSKTSAHLEQFATEGLRTLCIAQREINWPQYLEWNKRHQAAAAALERREEQMEEVADSIERELILLGGTAIEDRLQDGVPDSISILGQAGIKLWVLTGDKVETAINIGFSCNLLGNDMELLIIKQDLSPEEREKIGVAPAITGTDLVEATLDSYLRTYFQMDGSVEDLEAARGDHSPPNEGFGVVIDGDALKLILNDEEIRRKFLLLCKQCRAVLCCRVSPSQKAGVVRLVKDTLKVMTLAIGDGSNDVAMIQAADIGIGIAGEEGRQAVMSSDYAIGQFRFLTRLLLTHGRWSYKRFSEMIPSFFYKNVIFTIALFWYGIYNDFDGSYLFEFTYLMFYNLAFTSLPVIFLGILDQDVSSKVSLLVPELYRTGILRIELTKTKFYIYMLDGIYQSVVSFFFPYLMYYKGFPDMGGLVLDHRYWIGVVVTSIACISCNIYILFHQYRWDWWSSLFIFISIILVYFWTGVWTTPLYSEEFYKAAQQIFGNLDYWICTIVGVLVCLLPRFLYDFVQKFYHPYDIDIIRECWKNGDFDAYPEDYDPTDPNKPKISDYSKGQMLRLSGSNDNLVRSSSKESDLERQWHLNSSSTIQVNSTATPKDARSDTTVVQGQDLNSKSPVAQQAITEQPITEQMLQDDNSNRKLFLNVFKRKSNVKSIYDNNSFIESYNYAHAETNDSLVKTEEIALEEFDKNIKRASRISSDNKRFSMDRKRYSSDIRSPKSDFSPQE